MLYRWETEAQGRGEGDFRKGVGWIPSHGSLGSSTNSWVILATGIRTTALSVGMALYRMHAFSLR